MFFFWILRAATFDDFSQPIDSANEGSAVTSPSSLVSSFGSEIMKPKHAIWAHCAYAGLLILASTRFSVVSWIWGKWGWTWDYFQYSYRNGWGYDYRSDYSFVVVLTYLTAFLLGLIAHGMASTRVGGVWNTVAMILCVLGLASFTIEGSHWLWEHHLSWIAICPAASLLLAVISVIRLAKHPEPIAGGNAALPRASA